MTLTYWGSGGVLLPKINVGCSKLAHKQTFQRTTFIMAQLLWQIRWLKLLPNLVHESGFLTIEFLDRTINGVHITQSGGMQNATTWRPLALLPLCLCIGLELPSICNVVHVVLVTLGPQSSNPYYGTTNLNRQAKTWVWVVMDVQNFALRADTPPLTTSLQDDFPTLTPFIQL